MTPLLLQQPVTTQGHQPSTELVLVIQQMVALIRRQEVQIAALEARLSAAGIP